MHRRILLTAALFGALALSGCGFQPLYGGLTQNRIQGFSIEQQGDARIDYLVRDELRNVFTTDGSQYTLSIQPADVAFETAGIGADGVAVRYNIRVLVYYSVLEAGNPEPVLTGRAIGYGTFNSQIQPYAAISGQRASEALAAEDTARTIALQVARFLRTREGN